ncbi:MAG TPA: glucosyl transferase, partial [Bacteroidota bacterium]|nr:glucosyl transferase [Bacteroidota bacterium]
PQVDKSFDRISLIGGVENGQSINRVWGLTSKDIFGVGYAGMVAHYDGFTWTKLESGTTLDINDIWGATDPSTGEEQILGIASRLDVNEGNRLLQITRTTVTALADSGLPWSLNGIWFVPQEKYYIVGDGIYDADSATPSVWSGGANQVTTYYTTRIRANALNDILVVGAFGEVLHYNGASWKSYRSSQTALDGSYAGVAIKGNLAIAVGSSSSQAIIAMGKRNN